MNPLLSRDSPVIAEAYAKDASWAASEYGSQWRTDVEQFVSLESIMACIAGGVRERAPERIHRYVAAVDPAGGGSGSGADSMVLSIAHRAGDTAVLDLIREIRPPFSPETTVEEFAGLCRSYRVNKVWGDRWGGKFCREPFRKFGLLYELVDKPKSDFYRDLLPMVNSGSCDLLDHERLIHQLVSLERRTTRGGRDIIDHPTGAQSHDDVANGTAIALITAMKSLAVRPGSRVQVHEEAFAATTFLPARIRATGMFS
jgi:hypothetical protein